MLYSGENRQRHWNKQGKSMVSAGRKEVCRVDKKFSNILVALADLITPVAAGSCRNCYYEEKEPEGLQEFAAKKSKQEK